MKNGTMWRATGGALLISVLVMGCESADVVAPADTTEVDQSAAALKLKESNPPQEYRLPLKLPSVRAAPGSITSAMAALSWEPALGTGLNQGDDDCDFVSFGFSFDFYGATYTGAWVNSNGNMTFNGCNWDWWHPDIPDGSNVVIGPLYGDFNPSGGGDVYVNTVGTAPDRRFVVTWSGVPEYIGGVSNTFQAQLFEGSNYIQFGYDGLTTDGINWSFSSPSTDANQDVGISSGTGSFINSASGGDIPALDGTNICYRADGSTYTQVDGKCDVMPPVITATLTPVDGKSLKSKKGRFTVEFSCTDDCDDDPETTAMLGGVPVENGQVVDLRLKSKKSDKSDKSDKSEKSKKSAKSGKSGKSEKPVKIEGTADELVLIVVCTDDFGNESSAEVAPAFAEKSEKSKKSQKG